MSGVSSNNEVLREGVDPVFPGVWLLLPLRPLLPREKLGD